MKGPGLNISWRNKIPMSGLVWQGVCVSTSNYVTQPSLFNQTHHFLFKVEPMKPKKRILQDAATRPIFCMWYFRWWYMVGLRTAKSQPECFRERKYWSCSCTPCVALGPIAQCTRFLYKIKANPYFGSKRANAPNIALSLQFPRISRWENLSPSYANPPRGSSNHFLQTWQHQGMQEDNTQATCHQNHIFFLGI